MSNATGQTGTIYDSLPIKNNIPGNITALDMFEYTGRLYKRGAIKLLTTIYELIRENGMRGYLVYNFKNYPTINARLPFIARTLEQDGYSVLVNFVKEELIINWYVPINTD